MKLYEYSKNNNSLILKICGLTIIKYVKKYAKDNIVKIRHRYFLSNFIETIKYMDHLRNYTRKDVKIFSRLISSSVEREYTTYYYLFNKKIFTISITKKLNKYLHLFRQYDGIYITNSNLGETYLFLAYMLEAHIKQNQIKNPLIVITKQYHWQIIKLLQLNINYILLEDILGDAQRLPTSTIYKNKKFFVVMSSKYYVEASKQYLQLQSHLFFIS